MNTKQESHTLQSVPYTGEMYPNYSSPMYYGQPVHSAPAPQPPVTGVLPEGAVAAIPIKVISQGTTQLAYLSPAMPGVNINPLMLAHLPALQFTSEAAATSASVPVTVVAQDPIATSTYESEKLVNTSDGSSAPVAAPENDQLPNKLRYFFIFGLMSLALSAFFFIHTPILANSSRMQYNYCYTYSGSYKQSCYTYTKYWVLGAVNGFGYTAASVSLLVGAACCILASIKKKSHLTSLSFVVLLFDGLITLFFLAALIYAAINSYDIGVDTLMGYIIGFLIHGSIVATILYTFRKQGLSLNLTSPTLNSKRAVVGLGISGFNCLLSITGVILTAVFSAWIYSAAPSFVFLVASVCSFAANVMVMNQRKNIKAITLLFRIASAANWMIGGLAVFLSVIGFFAPFILGITIPVAIFAIANAFHAGASVEAIIVSPSSF